MCIKIHVINIVSVVAADCNQECRNLVKHTDLYLWILFVKWYLYVYEYINVAIEMGIVEDF